MGSILTFNCHEAYVHLLGKLGFELDVIDGLPGRYTASWDRRMRPVPKRARLIGLGQVRSAASYDVAIAHNLTDLDELRHFDIPKILVLHVSLRARAREESRCPPVSEMRARLAVCVRAIGASVVAVSKMKARSWGVNCRVIRPCADPSEYSGFEGRQAVALRVANQVLSRTERLDWACHERIADGLEVRVVGHNPGLDDSFPAESWDALKQLYRQHRAYLHTATLGLEDGYNISLVEAMTTGMPIVSSDASESPVVDGVNGFVASDPRRLNAALRELLTRRELALELGKRARETALAEFSVEKFAAGWHAAIEEARTRYRAHLSLSPLSSRAGCA